MDIPEAPNVFVVGDAATMTQDGHPVPGVAQAAIQQGRFVGHVIANRVRGRKDGRPFRYRNKGNMAVVGKNFAILEAGYLRSSGFVTWLVWAALHVLALPQLQNRARVIVVIISSSCWELHLWTPPSSPRSPPSPELLSAA
jgi:NADH dehydrogenase